MAASPTPRPTPASVAPVPAVAALKALAPALPVAVAFSGGADSTALLVAAQRLWPGKIHAIHIHHGLQPAASDFERQCRATCELLGVPLSVIRVNGRHRPGQSPEEAARMARYTALAEAGLALGLDTVLLAQHADDQVETVLLALGRGAGLPGLAAMPGQFERHGMRFERPFLGLPSAVLRAWLVSEGVAFVDDPMNADPAYTRSRIRHEILPALERTFPQFRETFARTARHAAQAQELLHELAAADLAVAGSPPAIGPLRQLTRARQANLLRHWLRSAHGAAASAAQLEELLDQVDACSTRGHSIRIKVGTGRVELEGSALRYVTSAGD